MLGGRLCPLDPRLFGWRTRVHCAAVKIGRALQDLHLGGGEARLQGISKGFNGNNDRLFFHRVSTAENCGKDSGTHSGNNRNIQHKNFQFPEVSMGRKWYKMIFQTTKSIEILWVPPQARFNRSTWAAYHQSSGFEAQHLEIPWQFERTSLFRSKFHGVIISIYLYSKQIVPSYSIIFHMIYWLKVKRISNHAQGWTVGTEGPVAQGS